MNKTSANFAAANEQFPDLSEFRTVLESLADGGLAGEFQFDRDQPVHIARAPGRLDLMGGIADYSGSLVLQLPIKEATFAAAQRISAAEIRLVSMAGFDTGSTRTAVVGMGEFHDWLALPYAEIRTAIHSSPEGDWAAYPLGVLIVLAKQLGWQLPTGLRMLFYSRVPEAKGVSSSAALEVAAMRSVCQVLGQTVSGAELARLCQLAENRVVGAPCGIMDQMTSAIGRQDQLLALRCQPADVRGFINLPEEVKVWGIDSGIRHAVSGSDYSAVRTGAFMGYRIIAELAGLRASEPNQNGRLEIDDPTWRGYLANLSPEEFEDRFAEKLPLEIRGEAFLKRYQGTTDSVTQVDPAQMYAVRYPTAHPIYENARVLRFAELLTQQTDPLVLTEMGQLMYSSHDSYSQCGLGSEETDQLVDMVRDSGSANGLFGAKITGGGSGGTVAVLGREGAEKTIQDIVRQYAKITGYAPFVFAGSSSGATCFPSLFF